MGARLAERIILELKDKMAEETLAMKVSATTASRPSKSGGDDDLIDALVVLGYRRPEAEIAARDAREEAEDLQSQIKIAVAKLSPAKAPGGRSS